MTASRNFLAALMVACTMQVPSVQAATFAAWEVANVGWDDILNMRAWPSSKSAIRAGYPDATPLMMTGRCMNGVDLRDIAAQPKSHQAEIVRHTWCEVWHDPTNTGDWQNGWVYGRYIRPQ